MSSARRSLLTATAAGTLLGALWFVPSAHASADQPELRRAQTPKATTTASPQATQQARALSASTATTSADTVSTDGTTPSEDASDAAGAALADTGSIDTTPYVVGGTLFLGVGAGFVVYSVRRERLGF